MKRRDFLSSSALVSAGVAGLARQARAFTLQSCESDSQSAACLEIARHNDVLAQISALLDKKGLSPAERQAALRTAVCPFCGQPLSG
jgi:hypothetical protein